MAWKTGSRGRNFEDLTDARFGWLVATSLAAKGAVGQTRWQVRCDCGREKSVAAALLKSGKVLSCGCYGKEQRRQGSTSHGLSTAPEYTVWKGMRSRCNNPRAKRYPDYGGRGICICERWNDFAAFLSDMGPRPSADHSIERKDTDGNYEQENCIWATDVEQANNKRNNRLLTCHGRTQTEAQWCRETGIKLMTLRQRIKMGWSHESALMTPVRTKRTPIPASSNLRPPLG